MFYVIWIDGTVDKLSQKQIDKFIQRDIPPLGDEISPRMRVKDCEVKLLVSLN